MQATCPPATVDHVLLAAMETCEQRWRAVLGSLKDDCHVSIQRACIAEWVEADDTVKRLVKKGNNERNPTKW